MKTTRTTTLLALALALPFFHGCLFSPPEKPPIVTPPVQYEPYDSPNSLIKNFELAWANRDYEEYRDNVLYNSTVENASDGEAYQSFIFYYADGEDIWGQELPEFEILEQELATVQAMFSGNSGEGPEGQIVPGIESIDLTLTRNQDWQEPSSPLIKGDVYPEGTRVAVYESDMLITLKGTIQDSDITGFTVDDDLKFYVIPVIADEGTPEERTEFRLWKWEDLFFE